MHEIYETNEGLQLDADGSPVALIKQGKGTLDLVWQVRGPQDLAKAKVAINGLLDLLVQYDRLQLTLQRQKER